MKSSFMPEYNKTYDCAIIGGGIAGLSLSIQLAEKGFEVIVFEKNTYPFHRVCGEYISNESLDFILRLGLPLKEMDLPQINKIGISTSGGFKLQAPLPLGGFGISRYKLDYELNLLAKAKGVTILEKCKVTNHENNTVDTDKGIFHAKIVVAAFGKTTPAFAKTETLKPSLANYVGVKYHIKTDFPADTIELHNFNKGYCGISKIEEDKFCLCYLTHNVNLHHNNNSIQEMENNVIRKNPFLNHIFSNSDFLFEHPVTISNIKFGAGKTSKNNHLYLGDAAGCISPLTGNGISMSAYASFLLSDLIHQYLKEKISYEQLLIQYDLQWKRYFEKRIWRGKKIQQLFENSYLQELVFRLVQPFGKIKSLLITSTHGKPF